MLNQRCHNYCVGNEGTRVGAGKPTVLTSSEEKEIVTTCQLLQELGFDLSK